jgi:hypothetical protein
MSDPNRPRLMTPPRPEEKRGSDIASGNVARDGFKRIARREMTDEFGFPSNRITPEVGRSDYRFGPRFHED